MDAIKIDKMDAALKLIDALFRRGEINQATYNNILQHQNLVHPQRQNLIHSKIRVIII